MSTSHDGFTTDERLLLVGQLKARRFSEHEHPDPFSRGWNAGIDLAIEVLFPLPTPTLTVRLCPVERGLRELVGAPAVDMRGTVELDLSQLEDEP